MDFIAGFIAGEGCFSIKLQSNTSCTYNVQFLPVASIRLHSRDATVIKEIQTLLDTGTIHRGSDMVALQIAGHSNSKDLIDQLNSVNSTIWHSSDKYQTFQEWKEFVHSYSYPDSEEEAIEMIKTAKQLNHGDKGLPTDVWCDRVNTT